MRTRDEKTKFLIEILSRGNYYEKKILSAAKNELHMIGLTDEDITNYIYKTEFVNELHKDDDESARVYGYPDQDHKPKNGLMNVLMSMIVLAFVLSIGVFLVWVLVDTENPQTQTVEQEFDKPIDGEAL